MAGFLLSTAVLRLIHIRRRNRAGWAAIQLFRRVKAMATRVVSGTIEIWMEKDGGLRVVVPTKTMQYIGRGHKDYDKYLKMYLAGGGEDLR